MISAATLSATLLLSTSASLASSYVDSFLDLHFTGANGVKTDVRDAGAIGLPKLPSGKPDCTGNLDGMLSSLEREARRKLPDGLQMALTSVTCEPLGQNWVKIVQRVPVTGAAASGE